MNKVMQRLFAILLGALFLSPPAFASLQYYAGTSSNSSGHGYAVFSTSSTPAAPGISALVVNRTSVLKSTGVIYTFDNIDTNRSGSGIWCDKDTGGTNKSTFYIRPTKGMEPYIAAPDKTNAMLYKTSIKGLYYTLYIKNFKAAYTTFSNPTFYLNSSIKNVVANNTYSCNLSEDYMGGFTMSLEVEFYTDNTLTIPETGTDAMGNAPVIVLTPSSGAYLFTIQNDEEGGAVDIAANVNGIHISFPTCFSTLSSTSGNVLNLGSYTASYLASNTKEVPFTINLASCVGVKNIEVRLTTSKVNSNNALLLGNQNEGMTDSASGAGVLIKGMANGVSSEMALQPNTTTSVYKDYETETITEFPMYFTAGTAHQSTSEIVNFTATLKADGTTIQPGSFKATGVFSITYP